VVSFREAQKVRIRTRKNLRILEEENPKNPRRRKISELQKKKNLEIFERAKLRNLRRRKISKSHNTRISESPKGKISVSQNQKNLGSLGISEILESRNLETIKNLRKSEIWKQPKSCFSCMLVGQKPRARNLERAETTS
jgi:hypothetical protein